MGMDGRREGSLKEGSGGRKMDRTKEGRMGHGKKGE